MLRIYNSLTRRKEEFVPIEPGKVRMYVCGMTVYDLCHVGHARVMVVFDVVARYLRASGFEVTYVRNITDIDDKIIRRAHERGENIQELTARYIEALHEDAEGLQILPPDREPRATESMEAIIAMVQRLLEQGYAYQGENGDIYYDVSHFEGYGALSGKQLDELRAGERVQVSEAKTDPLDFVLWKAAKPNEPAWDSPWGPGRPGWHIECSAMSTQALGPHFDIHGGGQDLQFPHHENEIAQSEAATGCKFVNYWMHNGFVRVDDEKMSKSLGNFFTVREVLEHYHPEVLRYFILSSHYRSPLNYTEQQLETAQAAVTRLYTALRGMPGEGISISAQGSAQELAEGDDPFVQRFCEAMDDDFNTPEALALLNEIRHALNRAREEGDKDKVQYLARLLPSLGAILGLLTQEPEQFLRDPRQAAAPSIVSAEGEAALSDGDIEQLIAQRTAARKNKDWAAADHLRDVLKKQGITLEDTPTGTLWRRG
ncbi:cysteinyl-tRNA synthetase [Nitrosococcus halophilus Nc 4]|uniref:Cysteine--tRNA ligase n=1 Tax=Nitrosococcus halophilus (strain Nc4) TaxID=472759 RepID=D5BYC7_NITHN|nr:cysteine--tRNA ligase [Nitrosococcus halophilus]ADE14110.1 cysteinyl-tRNA synthetase [Nitrosococcus halophilus Nc 4]